MAGADGAGGADVAGLEGELRPLPDLVGARADVVRVACQRVPGSARRRACGWCYDAFGLIGATFRELDWKTLVFLHNGRTLSFYIMV